MTQTMVQPTIFTEHVRALRPGASALPTAHLDALWQALRAALTSELKKRALWNAPPAYLGVYGGASWQGDTFEELLVECYASAFLSRLRSLRAQLEVRPSIDGLIFLNIRNFLYDTQKKHDPLGFRVFSILRAAVLRRIAAGVLHVLAGEAKIRNSTVLGADSGGDAEEAAKVDLGDTVRAWNDELLPDLVTAQGKAQPRVVARVDALLGRLASDGVAVFRFRDLCDPLKNDARMRWATLWQREQGEAPVEDPDQEFVTMVQQVRPDTEFEQREGFAKLLACVSLMMDRLETAEATRAYLGKLWIFLRSHAAGSDTPVGGNGGKLPSRRKIARLLGIPRDRLAALNATLGELIESCRRQLRNGAVITEMEERAGERKEAGP